MTTSRSGKEQMASLDDLMLAAGVVNTPAWFSDIRLPNWPFPHQMDAIKQLASNIRFGLFDEPGTGKTFPAQVHAILMASLGNKVVFTMPPKLLRQFIGEFTEFFQGIENHLHIAHLDVGAVQKSKLTARWDKQGWPDILLISYDSFRQFNARSKLRTVPRQQWKLPPERWADPRVPENYWASPDEAKDRDLTPHTADGDPIVFRKGVAKAKNRNQLRLKQVGYNVFFFDEAHALCNPDAIVWKSVQHMDHELRDDIAMYLMTGTPTPTHLHNVYGLIRLLDRTAYLNKQQFMRRHVIKNPNARYLQVLGYKKQEEIYTNLYRHARRVQKREVLKLKDPLISATPIRLAGKHKKLYDQIIRDRFAVLGETVLAPDNDSALRNLALQLISCPDEFDDSGELGQDNELTKWLDLTLESINPAERKVVIFAHFKRTIAFLAKRYAEWNPAVMNGATASAWRQVDKFKEDDSSRLFIVNWASGGAGLNLQVASQVIFYEVPTSPKDAKQGIARCDRNGQQETVNAYFPRVLGTLLDRNFKNLLKNEQSNNEVVRDKHDLLYRQLGVGRKAA